MNIIFLTLLLQSSLLLPPRFAVENPASVSPVPKKLQKDYDKLWMRFLSAKDDAKLLKDLDKFLQKQKTFDPAWMIQGYLALYKGDDIAARGKFVQALGVNSNNRIALYYLAELADAHAEYARAAALYAQLQSIDPNHPEIETKRQKAFLLATDNLLRTAAQAEKENRLAEAEDAYRQALTLAPNEPALQNQLAELLIRQNRKEEAEALKKRPEDLSPRQSARSRQADEGKKDDLEDLGRWGSEIDIFHKIRDMEALTREQFATLIVRYFPQVTEFRQTPRIITDIQASSARSEIQNVVGVGLMDPFPNHDFEPSEGVSRGDLAIAFARLSRLLGLSADPAAQATAPDVTPTNALYPEIQLVLGYSIMTLEDSGSFNVSGHVSGRQAVSSAGRLLSIFQQAQH
jgi:tetratricopeptide (TPR) repeat protein